MLPNPNTSMANVHSLYDNLLFKWRSLIRHLPADICRTTTFLLTPPPILTGRARNSNQRNFLNFKTLNSSASNPNISMANVHSLYDNLLVKQASLSCGMLNVLTMYRSAICRWDICHPLVASLTTTTYSKSS